MENLYLDFPFVLFYVFICIFFINNEPKMYIFMQKSRNDFTFFLHQQRRRRDEIAFVRENEILNILKLPHFMCRFVS